MNPHTKALTVLIGTLGAFFILWLVIFSGSSSRNSAAPREKLVLKQTSLKQFLSASDLRKYNPQTFSFEKSADLKFSNGIQNLQQEIQSIKGNLMVHFWASWCAPCLSELPQFAKLAKIFAAKGKPIAIILISADSQEKDIHTMLKSFPELVSSSVQIFWEPPPFPTMNLWSINQLPETYFFSNEKIVLHKVSGAIDWLSAENQSELDKIFQ